MSFCPHCKDKPLAVRVETDPHDFDTLWMELSCECGYTRLEGCGCVAEDLAEEAPVPAVREFEAAPDIPWEEALGWC